MHSKLAMLALETQHEQLPIIHMHGIIILELSCITVCFCFLDLYVIDMPRLHQKNPGL